MILLPWLVEHYRLATFTMDSAGIGSKVGDILESAALNLPIGLPLQISGLVANISGLVTRLASNLFPDKIFEAEEPHKTSKFDFEQFRKKLKAKKTQGKKKLKQIFEKLKQIIQKLNNLPTKN